MSEPIRYWDRSAGEERVEKVYGEGGVRFLYGNAFGSLIGLLLARKWFSRLVGAYYSSRFSKGKIARFVQQFDIPMEDYDCGPFLNFNEFFIRRFADGKRKFVEGPRLPAVAEGRYLAWEAIQEDQSFPVKGKDLSAAALLGSAERAEPFVKGPLVIARLCPVDYHRFHFPDEGKLLYSYTISGQYHSVNPLALARRSDIFVQNERQVSILETQHFGKIAYIEVGAMCVGKIVQTSGGEFHRGDEKGYFLFGGSTVILLGEPNRWKPDADLLTNTQARKESFVRLGEQIGSQ